jgi:hypothetical protein
MPPRCRAGRAEADGIALRGAFNDSLEGGAMRPHASHGAAARPDGPAACAPDARLLRRRPAPRPVTAAARRGTPPTVHKAGPACAPTASSLRRHPANAEFGASTCSPPGRGAFPLPPGSRPRCVEPDRRRRAGACVGSAPKGVAGGDGWSDGWRTLGVPCALPAPTDRFRLRPDRGVTPLPSAFVTIYGRSGPFIINRGTC